MASFFSGFIQIANIGLW